MGVLDQVTDLKNKGMSENEIIGSLREKGISPKEINDALSQSEIKNAVSSQDYSKRGGMEPSIMRPERAEPLPTEGAAPSDYELTPPPSFSRIPKAAQSNFGSMTQEYDQGQNQDYVPQPEGEYYPQEQYQQYPYSQQSPQENYGGYQQDSSGGYYPQENYGYGEAVGVTDTDTMIEIAEQVFSEKIKLMSNQLESLNEFKTLAESKIENISERLKRIEVNIDRLQSAILEKVGSYGRGLDLVKKEMSMMQDSFGKLAGSMSGKHHPSHIVHRSKKETTVVHKSKTKKKSRKKSSKKK